MSFTRQILVLFILVCTIDAKATPIWNARKIGPGYTVTVNGIALNGSELGNVRYISDGSGTLCLFGSSLSTVNRGDSLTATGTLVNYNDLLEMSPVTSFSVLSSNRPLPLPLQIECWHLNEYNEGNLVKVRNASFVGAGATFIGNTTYTLLSNGFTCKVFVRNGSPLVGQTIPSGFISITGICSEFNGQYQLLPRTLADITSTPLYFTSQAAISNQSASSFRLNAVSSMAGNSFVRFGLTPALELGVVNGNTASSTHNVTLTGLQAAKAYYAQLCVVSGNDTASTAPRVYSTASAVSGSFKVWFNRPVDQSRAVPAGNLATRLTGGVLADSIAAIIDKAALTVDLAMYNFGTGTTTQKIITALNNAVGRGVVVRYIYDEGSFNAALSNLVSGVHKLASPVASFDGYNIMHNKFLVIDANSTAPQNPLVLAGSTNFTSDQINSDANNVLVVRDQAVARAYRDEFNEMWGGSAISADTLAARFGYYKRENTAHEFLVNGKLIEVYFSPSDNTEEQIRKSILTAGTNLYFANLIFTASALSQSVNLVKSTGAYCAGLINDTAGSDPTAFLSMKAVLGAALQLYDWTSQPGILHHKYVIADQATGSDPLVSSGSHNFTYSANTINDENTMIVHDAAISNQFYQEFAARFNENGGALSLPENRADEFLFGPNPVKEVMHVRISHELLVSSVQVMNCMGQVINIPISERGNNEWDIRMEGCEAGTYLLLLDTNQGVKYRRFVHVR